MILNGHDCANRITTTLSTASSLYDRLIPRAAEELKLDDNSINVGNYVCQTAGPCQPCYDDEVRITLSETTHSSPDEKEKDGIGQCQCL
jgi:hypothetical protein